MLISVRKIRIRKTRFLKKSYLHTLSKVSSVRASDVTALSLMPIIFFHQGLQYDDMNRFHQIPSMCFEGAGGVFLRIWPIFRTR